MTGERPSVIVARYRAGELTRDGAAERLTGAAWDTTYTPASMAPGGDYEGSDFADESFAVVVYVPKIGGQLDDADYAAFHAAFGRWRSSSTGA